MRGPAPVEIASWIPSESAATLQLILSDKRVPAEVTERLRVFAASPQLKIFWRELAKAAKAHPGGLSAFPMVVARSMICFRLLSKRKRPASNDLLSSIAGDLLRLGEQLETASESDRDRINYALAGLAGARMFRPLLRAASRRLAKHVDLQICDLSPGRLASASKYVWQNGGEELYFVRSILIFFRDSIRRPLYGSTAELINVLYPSAAQIRAKDFVQKQYRQIAAVEPPASEDVHAKEMIRYLGSIWLQDVISAHG